VAVAIELEVAVWVAPAVPLAVVVADGDTDADGLTDGQPAAFVLQACTSAMVISPGQLLLSTIVPKLVDTHVSVRTCVPLQEDEHAEKSDTMDVYEAVVQVAVELAVEVAWLV
jgi:hypothetical protein